MKIELLSSTKNQDINISDNAFSKDFNESLVHQAVVSFMAGSRQEHRNKKLDLKLEAVEKNLIGKKELVEQEQVP